ncbi:hypothetical protein B296_00003985 [Ensete ventricosum]|uniref:galactinol--sucrose galactosyltransferase n=1 Tax=Ensete ventricosum TaxID=4639 RepID=A0A427B2Z3_ENSVE|nr:hypothetical protein B296_00003985 [Ensete ventricosum]
MAQKMGDQGRDIPHETQFLLLESKDGSQLTPMDGSGSSSDGIVYTVFLPLVEGPFRACLQGNSRDELELCLESGDDDTKSASFSHALFVGAASSDPFAAIAGAFDAVKSRLKSFRHRSDKKLPGVVDYFGWCTWDAFYQDVTQDGVEAGLRSLTAGGAPPRFVIIDDGWQSVGSDQSAEETEKPSPLLRLTGIKENGKFRSKEDPAAGIKTIVQTAKDKYGLKYVYVWHAITGYWGGVRPGVEGMEDYNSKMQYPKVSPGVVENEPGMKTDVLTMQGLGLVHPKSVYKFYNELHSYLAAAGIDGVKVDVQCILETLGAGHGGRVELTRQYHRALDASIAKNFPDNGCIACMSHNTDALYWSYSGVLGVFNCQGAAWSSTEKKNMFHRTTSEALTCAVRGSDVHLVSEAATDRDWKGDCVAFRHRDGELALLPFGATMPVSLKVMEHEIFTVSPIKVWQLHFQDLAPGIRFAPIGLVDMYNAGAAVEGLTYHALSAASKLESDSGFGGNAVPPLASRGPDALAIICMEIKGCGRFGAYSSVRPRRCSLGSVDVEFAYDSSSGFLALHLEAMPKGDKRVHNVVVEV